MSDSSPTLPSQVLHLVWKSLELELDVSTAEDLVEALQKAIAIVRKGAVA